MSPGKEVPMCQQITVRNCCDCPLEGCAEFAARCSDIPDDECWDKECEECPAAVNYSYVAS